MTNNTSQNNATNSVKIKVGVEENTQKSIFLHHNGVITCGNYAYSGKLTNNFSEIFNYIAESIPFRSKDRILDVSRFKQWDAREIYEEFIAIPWKKSIGAKKMHELSIECDIYNQLSPIRNEFKRNVTKKWKKIFKKTDPSDATRPTKAWQILLDPSDLAELKAQLCSRSDSEDKGAPPL